MTSVKSDKKVEAKASSKGTSYFTASTAPSTAQTFTSDLLSLRPDPKNAEQRDVFETSSMPRKGLKKGDSPDGPRPPPPPPPQSSTHPAGFEFQKTGHSFPFQLQSLARKWFHIIPNKAILDFTSIDDVIDDQLSILNGIVKRGVDSFSQERLQEIYETSRIAMGRAITDGATIIRNSLGQDKAMMPDNREAYKEYATVSHTALVYLINRINHLLAEYDRQIPKLLKRALEESQSMAHRGNVASCTVY